MSVDMLQQIKNRYHFVMAALAVMWYRNPAKKMRVIGVTGTDGKTTTASMIYHILHTLGFKVALVSTVAAFVGDDQVETGFHVTSPGPWQLQKLLARMAREHFQILVLEVTSHGLDQHRLLGVPIETAVYTNVTREHLDYHRTYEAYLATKATMMRGVARVLLNKDDGSYPYLKALVPPVARLQEYSQNMLKELPSTLRSLFPESYNRMNALAAILTVEDMQVTQEQALNALQTFKGIPGRMERIPNARGIEVVVDFAHTPNALESALSSLREQMSDSASLIAVYGAAGLRDYFKRPLMGEIGARLADMAVLTAEDPRTEDPRVIIRQMKEQLRSNHNKVISIVDRAEAIDFAINTLAKKGDVVAIFGKGHERSMNLDGAVELPWSDQAEARKSLAVLK